MMKDDKALQFFSTNGAVYTSPGQRPGFRVPLPLSPEGAIHQAAEVGLGRPFRARMIGATHDPGRCPGLAWGRAFGPQDSRARRVHGAVPSKVAIIALHRSVGDAALQAGNSESIVKRHYLNTQTREEGAEFFRIIPDRGHRRAVLAKPAPVRKSHLRAV
jgi:hypothetical protein